MSENEHLTPLDYVPESPQKVLLNRPYIQMVHIATMFMLQWIALAFEYGRLPLMIPYQTWWKSSTEKEQVAAGKTAPALWSFPYHQTALLWKSELKEKFHGTGYGVDKNSNAGEICCYS